MWLNEKYINDSIIKEHRKSLLQACPAHLVIDGLFNQSLLDEVVEILQKPHCWAAQRHSYSALYVDNDEWKKTDVEQRFVQRDVWRKNVFDSQESSSCTAQKFLIFLRSKIFMSLLKKIFNVQITDINVENPQVNTNYFRVGVSDFIRQHADDSPGRKICMLLYLNKNWNTNDGGDLTFLGQAGKHVRVSPDYNRCVLFDPASEGSEHWVDRLNSQSNTVYRYNVTSWYWSE